MVRHPYQTCANWHEAVRHTFENESLCRDFHANFHEGPATPQKMEGFTDVFHAKLLDVKLQ